MKKRYLVNLTVEEREVLTQLVRRDRVSGLKRLRASILLKADEGLTDQEIGECQRSCRFFQSTLVRASAPAMVS